MLRCTTFQRVEFLINLYHVCDAHAIYQASSIDAHRSQRRGVNGQARRTIGRREASQALSTWKLEDAKAPFSEVLRRAPSARASGCNCAWTSAPRSFLALRTMNAGPPPSLQFRSSSFSKAENFTLPKFVSWPSVFHGLGVGQRLLSEALMTPSFLLQSEQRRSATLF